MLVGSDKASATEMPPLRPPQVSTGIMLDSNERRNEMIMAGTHTEIPGARNVDVADKRINVQYYAILREQAGRSDESVLTGAKTPRDLYNELKSRYPFSLAPEMLRVAVNAEFGEWSQRLADGDSVVFIPPVAGG